MEASESTEKTLVETFLDYAKEAARKSVPLGLSYVDDAAVAKNQAAAALSHMQSMSLAHQYEVMLARAQPNESEQAESLVAYRGLALELEQQFRNAGTDTAKRIADRIKAVIDEHG